MIRILIPGPYTDSRLSQLAGSSAVEELLKAGAGQLRERFQLDCKDAEKLDSESWANRGLYRRLDEVFERSAKLARIFFNLMVRDHALLTERIVNIARQSSAHRVAHFLLEMKVRLRIPDTEFELPLKQSIMADALGISAVHNVINRKAIRASSPSWVTSDMPNVLNVKPLLKRSYTHQTHEQYLPASRHRAAEF